VEIKQLTVKGIKDLQKVLDVNKTDDVAGLKTLSAIFRQTIVGAENMKDSEFEDFPIKALTELSQEILVYNGLAASDDKGGALGKKS
jgi:hypothetical protein|tara:strand:- start:2118 stop:2378 length:261 start_codon:yes stop_codon:yes gene_type:complete